MLPKNILVPIDFSPSSEHALDYACALARELGATVHLVHAIGPTLVDLPIPEHAVAEVMRSDTLALQQLAAARGALCPFGPPHVTIADPRDAIRQTAAELPADLIVMGTHGRRGIARLLIGSVAEETVRRAPCAVLTIRRGLAEEA